MNHAERVAQALIEQIVDGSRMIRREDHGRSVHDFDLHYRDGEVEAVEVTASMDQQINETDAAIRDSRKGGPTIKTRWCKKDWHIHPEPDANITRIRNDADRLLATLEASGIEEFFGPGDWHEHPAIDALYRGLRVFSGSVIRSRTGCILMAPPGSGGAVGATLALDAVRSEALKEDNRRKLASAGTSERHLAVYIDVMNFCAWCALIDFDPPAILPDLPREITDVWAFSEVRRAGHFSVWRASRRDPWRNLGPVACQIGSVDDGQL
jgi:hypothetical protein